MNKWKKKEQSYYKIKELTLKQMKQSHNAWNHNLLADANALLPSLFGSRALCWFTSSLVLIWGASWRCLLILLLLAIIVIKNVFSSETDSGKRSSEHCLVEQKGLWWKNGGGKETYNGLNGTQDRGWPKVLEFARSNRVTPPQKKVQQSNLYRVTSPKMKRNLSLMPSNVPNKHFMSFFFFLPRPLFFLYLLTRTETSFTSCLLLQDTAISYIWFISKLLCQIRLV